MRSCVVWSAVLIGTLLGGSIAWNATSADGLNWGADQDAIRPPLAPRIPGAGGRHATLNDAEPSVKEHLVTVPSTATIWLANQPDGASFRLAPFSEDFAPQQSPVAIELSSLGHPTSLAFRVEGLSGRGDPWPLVAADGEAVEPIGPAFGLSQTAAPFMSLVGVFIDRDQHQQAVTPTPSDFSNADQRSFELLSPVMQQVFFIGDGLTGTGEGRRQTFAVPAGADVLYLAPFDFESSNNAGDLEVAVVANPPDQLERLRELLLQRTPTLNSVPTSLVPVVERLRKSKAARADRLREEGRAAGEMWAKEFAEYDQLLGLAEVRQIPNWSANLDLKGVVAAATNGEMPVEQFFHVATHSDRPIDLQKLADRDYLQAFVEGATAVWDQVKDHL